RPICSDSLAPSSSYTLSLHDALPISDILGRPSCGAGEAGRSKPIEDAGAPVDDDAAQEEIGKRVKVMIAAVIITFTRLPISSWRSEEHTSELQSPAHIVFRLLLERIT